MEIRFEDKELLFAELARRGVGKALSGRPAMIVGVDGARASGKTTVSYCIACRLSLPVLDIDHFLRKKRGAYQDRVSYPDLRYVIDRYREEGQMFIVEGLCLLSVLGALSLAPDIVIYVRRVDGSGEWMDAPILDHRRPHGEIRPRIDALTDMEAREVGLYHLEHRPLDKAAYIVDRADGDS